MVRVEGLEPPRLAAPEPKSGASTNSATPADARGKAGRAALAKPFAGGEEEIASCEPMLGFRTETVGDCAPRQRSWLALAPGLHGAVSGGSSKQ